MLLFVHGWSKKMHLVVSMNLVPVGHSNAATVLRYEGVTCCSFSRGPHASVQIDRLMVPFLYPDGIITAGSRVSACCYLSSVYNVDGSTPVSDLIFTW